MRLAGSRLPDVRRACVCRGRGALRLWAGAGAGGRRHAPLPAAPGITIALLPSATSSSRRSATSRSRSNLSAALGRPVTFKLLDNYQLIFSELREKRSTAPSSAA